MNERVVLKVCVNCERDDGYDDELEREKET